MFGGRVVLPDSEHLTNIYEICRGVMDVPTVPLLASRLTLSKHWCRTSIGGEKYHRGYIVHCRRYEIRGSNIAGLLY